MDSCLLTGPSLKQTGRSFVATVLLHRSACGWLTNRLTRPIALLAELEADDKHFVATRLSHVMAAMVVAWFRGITNWLGLARTSACCCDTQILVDVVKASPPPFWWAPPLLSAEGGFRATRKQLRYAPDNISWEYQQSTNNIPVWCFRWRIDTLAFYPGHSQCFNGITFQLFLVWNIESIQNEVIYY